MTFVPWAFSKWILNIFSFLIYDLNLNLTFLGIPKDPFGSVMITNVGSLGVDMAWAPLVPYSKVPMLLTLGSIKDTPVVIDEKIEIRPIMKIGIFRPPLHGRSPRGGYGATLSKMLCRSGFLLKIKLIPLKSLF
jgi:hypothetical protein